MNLRTDDEDGIGGISMARFIDEMMEELPVANSQVAKRLRCSTAAVRMFREGRAKVPFEKIPSLADAIGADRRGLMERALREYLPELVTILIEIYGSFTEDQWKVIKVIRELSGLEDHPYVDTRLRACLQATLVSHSNTRE